MSCDGLRAITAERLSRGSLTKRPIHPNQREAEKHIRKKQQQAQESGYQTAEA